VQQEGRIAALPEIPGVGANQVCRKSMVCTIDWVLVPTDAANSSVDSTIALDSSAHSGAAPPRPA